MKKYKLNTDQTVVYNTILIPLIPDITEAISKSIIGYTKASIETDFSYESQDFEFIFSVKPKGMNDDDFELIEEVEVDL